ncbi:MAG: hypothetical protein WBZ37_02440 [Mycobacterium sp.]
MARSRSTIKSDDAAVKSDDSALRTLLSLLIPNAVVGLSFIAAVFLVLAIFVFGEHGPLANPLIADLTRTAGISSGAAMLTTILDRHYFSRDLEDRIVDRFREAADRTKTLATLGVNMAYPSFDFGRIFLDARAGETVSWLDTYCPQENAFLDKLVNATNHGVLIRMLIIVPTCENAKFRSVELAESFDTGEVWDDGLKSFISKMKSASARSEGKFEVRFYQDLPCVPMYLVGTAPKARKGYFSLFLVRPTANAQHLELGPGEWLDDMAKYFEHKWARHAT